MSQRQDRERSIDAKIARLRERLKDRNNQAVPITNMKSVLFGILDLLDDEL